MDRARLEPPLFTEDPVALADAAAGEELSRIKLAEEILELRHERHKRASVLSVSFQSLVGVVAVAGFVVNAYQIYETGKQQATQERADQARWEQEFQRAKRSDKYRAFFETSALATDPTNPAKRLVGYSLLQEFVADKDYNSKATLMLETALAEELRHDNQPGLSEEHRAAVIAILSALSGTSDCEDLARAARTVDFIGERQARTGDLDEAREVFAIYVRRLLGRAAVVCRSYADFDGVRRPLRQTLAKLPELAGLATPPDAALANRALASILKERCAHEDRVSGVSDCPDLLASYERQICAHVPPADQSEEAPACALLARSP